MGSPRAFESVHRGWDSRRRERLRCLTRPFLVPLAPLPGGSRLDAQSRRFGTAGAYWLK
jgi:hypothetical protein